MSGKIDEGPVVATPRSVIDNSETRDETTNTASNNECPSARSSASIKKTENTENDGNAASPSSPPEPPTPRTNNSSEDSTNFDVTTSNTSTSEKPSSETSSGGANNNTKPPSRNPITGCGLGADGLKARRNCGRRDGNPVTGEGYKGSEINTSIPSLNGANQVINKNRIPPGGFSSGLW